MSYRVFVDGQEGTTGLEIEQRLSRHADVELVRIDPGRRKDPSARRELLRQSDIAFLCLPDAAARESVALAAGAGVRLVDASTAHRTDPAWVYGLPELDREQRSRIAQAQRVSVPGCYATGFVAAVAPLLKAGLLAPDSPVSCNALSGYSGGGKKLIAAYEDAARDERKLEAPRLYALSLRHKHLPEMQQRAGLACAPLFSPMVGDFYRGMLVSIPLLTRAMARPAGARGVHDVVASHYAGERFVRVMPFDPDAAQDGGFLDATSCNETNRLDLFVFGNDEQVLVVSRLDNLGKGASGAAVQCMNLMLGLDEGSGLDA